MTHAESEARQYSTNPHAIYMRKRHARLTPEQREQWRAWKRATMRRRLQNADFRVFHASRNHARLKERRADPQSWAGVHLSRIRYAAKRRGLVFNLTVEDLMLPAVCPVFGTPFVLGAGSGHPRAPSVDRLDTTQGYAKGNVAVISQHANNIKSAARTAAEVQAVADWMKSQGL